MTRAPSGLDALASQIYPALRAAARRMMARERPGHTLQPTALVHEAFLRLAKQAQGFRDKVELQVCAARVMRQILVNHAHARGALSRGGDRSRADCDLDALLLVRQQAADVDVLELDEALHALGQLDARQHHIVELRYFGGLSSDEVGAALGISGRTVQREWRMAQAWLRERLGIAGA